MKRMLVFLLAGVAGCSAQPSVPAPVVAQSAQTSCIDLTQVTGRRVIAPDAVLFDTAGGISYRAELVGGCPGAARANGSEIIQTETQSTHLCRDDHIRIYDPVEAKATGPGSFAMCRVGGFTAVPRP